MAKQLKSPTPKKYPKGITEDGKPIWEHVVTKYKKQIRSYDEVTKQLAVAIIIYRRSCAKAGVIPFLGKSDKSHLDNITDIKVKLNSIAKKSKVFVKRFQTKLNDLISSISREQLDSVTVKKGLLVVSTVATLRLRKGETAQSVIARLIKDFGCTKKIRGAVKIFDPKLTTIFEYETRTDSTILMYQNYNISLEQAKLLLDLPKIDKDTLPKITSYFKRWLKNGKEIRASLGDC